MDVTTENWERDVIERSFDYPENSAGRRMQTEFIAVPPAWTVGRTIDHLREAPDLPDRFWEVYVADSAGLLQGTVALDGTSLAPGGQFPGETLARIVEAAKSFHPLPGLFGLGREATGIIQRGELLGEPPGAPELLQLVFQQRLHRHQVTHVVQCVFDLFGREGAP